MRIEILAWNFKNCSLDLNRIHTLSIQAIGVHVLNSAINRAIFIYFVHRSSLKGFPCSKIVLLTLLKH